MSAIFRAYKATKSSPANLKAVGDPREIVRDPEARYWGRRVEELSLVPLGEARLGRIGLDEWLRRSRTGWLIRIRQPRIGAR